MGAPKYRFGAFELDAATFELRRDGVLVPIQRRAFDLLHYLVEHAGVVVTKEDLLANVWSGLTVTKDSLPQAIMAVRHALGDDVNHPSFVLTVRGRGYRFVAVAPPTTTTATTTILVGRDREIATLREKMSRATAGSGGIILLHGETGSGKTSLVDEACSHCAAPARAIRVRCSSAEGVPKLFPWLQALRELRCVVPAAAKIEEASARFELFEAIIEEVRVAAETSPILLAFDDLENADAWSLALLELLASRLRSMRLLVIAAYGPSASASVARIAREPAATQIRLAPLTAGDVARFVEQSTGKSPSPALLEKLLEKTQGNPLFLSELMHVLRAEERLRANELATSVLVGGDGMRDAITQHLAALAEETTRVVVVAAVFGRAFRLAPLAAALGEPNETVLRSLDDLEAARIVRRTGSGTYRFTVPIVRDVLYRKLSASERARLHGVAAKALEEHLGSDTDHEELAEIAAHLVDAAPSGDVARAADLSIRAAELAKAAGAHEAAARYATRGLDALRFAQKVDTARQRRLTELTRS